MMTQRDWHKVMMILSFIYALGLYAGRATAAEVEAFVGGNHTSDLIRGCPRRCWQQEPTQEFLGGGATITAGKKLAWEIDLAHGLKWIDGGRRETGSQLGVRFYPGRLRK